MQDVKQAYDYIEALRRMGRKETTLKNYEKILVQLLGMLGDAGRPTRAEDITTEEILFLYHNLTTKEEVTKLYLRVLAGMIIHFTGIDVVKQTNLLWNRAQYQRSFLKDEEIRTIYQRADPTERIIIVLGAFLGLRRAEISRIRDEDIIGDSLTIHGKGHTEQGLVVTLRMSGTVMEEIRRFRAWKSGHRDSGDGFLVQTVSARTGNVLKGMTPSAIGERMRMLGIESGIHVSAHALRRYYATTIYYRTDGDIRTMASMMRHSNVSTTFKCYVQPFDEKQTETQDRVDSYIASVLA